MAGPTDRPQLRSLLSREPTTFECVRAAAALSGTRAHVVVFERAHGYVVASSGTDSMVPRPLTRSEQRLLEEGHGSNSGPDDLSFPVVQGSEIVGALTLLGAGGQSAHGAAYEGLARIISARVAALVAPTGAEGIPPARLLEAMRDAVVVLDESFTVTYANGAVASLIGTTPVEMMGTCAVDLLHPEDVAEALQAIEQARAGLQFYRVVVRLVRSDGAYEPVEITGQDMSDDPEIAGIVLCVRGAAHEAELEHTAHRSQRMADAIVGGLHEGIVATDQFGGVTLINDIARKLFLIDPDVPPATLSLQDFALSNAQGEAVVPHPDPEKCGLGADSRHELCLVNERSDVRWIDVRRRAVQDREGRPLGSVLLFDDITASRKAQADLESQALHDLLTGLANRRQLERFIAELAARSEPVQVAALFVDLDGFKTVNDAHGHGMGDRVIRLAAQRLSNELRATDLLARQGGDEFVVLHVGTGPEAAVALAERLRDRLSRPYSIDEHRFDVTASIGVAVLSSQQLHEERLLANADLALYAAKAKGRNRVELFDTDLAETVQAEDLQRRTLRDALDEGRVAVHFQPLVNARTEQTTGYEALVRIMNEDGLAVGPASFIDVVETSSMVWDLDRRAFGLSCQAAALLARVEPSQPPTVACNFSPYSLSQPDFFDTILSITQVNGVDPSQICVEITERAAYDTGAANRSCLEELASAGFKLALDDFGTGYSSLAHLRDLPITSIKVDRTFVSRLTLDGPERAIADAVVSLSKGMGLTVVAEGVETAEQLRHCREMGFTTIQGWYYSPALPLPAALDNWLTSGARQLALD